MMTWIRAAAAKGRWASVQKTPRRQARGGCCAAICAALLEMGCGAESVTLPSGEAATPTPSIVAAAPGDAAPSGGATPVRDATPQGALAVLAEKAPVLSVNETTLTRTDLERAMMQHIGALGYAPARIAQGDVPPAVLARVEALALDSLLERELLRQEARRRGLEPDAEVLAQEKAKLVAQIPEGRSFDDILSMMKSDEAQFMADLGADLAIARLVDQVREAVPELDEAAARRVYAEQKQRYADNDRVRGFQILVLVPGEATPAEVDAARARAERLRNMVNGKDEATFRKVAKENSDDVRTKRNGGDLGELSRQQLLPEVGEALFGLAVGAVSPPVRSDRGFHVLRGGGVVAGEPHPFEQVKERILLVERMEAAKRAHQALLADLQAKSRIVRHYAAMPPPLASPHGASGGPHGLPPPSKDNVLPGVSNPHGKPTPPPAADLSTDPPRAPNVPTGPALRLPAGALSAPTPPAAP